MMFASSSFAICTGNYWSPTGVHYNFEGDGTSNTVCDVCPANSHGVAGANGNTACMCNDGYTQNKTWISSLVQVGASNFNITSGDTYTCSQVTVTPWCVQGADGTVTIVTAATAPFGSLGHPFANGTCPFAGGGCLGDSCGTFTDASQFKFDIESGGINHSMYVCEVGFDAHLCLATGCSSDDYMYVDTKNAAGATVKVLIKKTDAPKVFTAADQASAANVVLNSTNYGAGWYFKYCLDIVRAVADGNWTEGTYTATAPIPSSTDVNASLLARITADLVITGANDNGYFSQSGLESSVTSICTNGALVIGHNDANQGLWSPVGSSSLNFSADEVTCLSGLPGCDRKTCTWTVSFRETQKCLRTIKNCVGTACDLFHGTVSTTLTTSTALDCTNCP